MSAQPVRMRAPRRQQQMERVRRAAEAEAEAAKDRQQMAAVVAALAEHEDELEAEPTEAAEPQAPPIDASRVRAQKILDQLTEYGVQVPMQEIRKQAVQRALLMVLLDNIETLIDKGLFTEEQMAATVHALEADVFAQILLNVEQQRLNQEQQARQPVAAKIGELWVPGRQ